MSNVLGKCPLCGGDVVENNKAYGCSNWKTSDGGCKFTVWKTTSSKEIPVEQVKKLMKDKETDYMEGFVSKAGKSFEAKLIIDEDKKVSFAFRPKN